MKRLALAFCSVTFPLMLQADGDTPLDGMINRVTTTVSSDYENFYTYNRLIDIGIGFGVGGIVANTPMDENIKNWYQNNIRSKQTDAFSKVAKQFGNGRIMVPVALLCASTKLLDKMDSRVGDWGAYVSRAYIVGVPVLLTGQVLTGGSRPDERSYNSQWRPFADNNGVSGHAYMGAVPFIAVAKMYDESVFIKYTAYACSFLTAWSRINDNAHYTSQVALGWFIAYESVDAVFAQHNKREEISFVPFVDSDGYGIRIKFLVE